MKLAVEPDAIVFFTTLLQSGIHLPCPTGTAAGVFLAGLPGFDVDYISDRIQTIFLDGDAIDDLERPLSQPCHVLALSAAMPGLAGAIFRKNSLCAALRTRQETVEHTKSINGKSMVRLKLFNMIAKEKGAAILALGGFFPGSVLVDFFTRRPALLPSIHSLELDSQVVDNDTLLASLSPDINYHFSLEPAPTRQKNG